MREADLNMFNLIRDKARQVLPAGVKSYLYGSRARGDAHKDSDWDILIIVNEPTAGLELYDTLAYPLTELGWRHGVAIVPVIYSIDEWNDPASFLFRHNVEQDAIALT